MAHIDLLSLVIGWKVSAQGTVSPGPEIRSAEFDLQVRNAAEFLPELRAGEAGPAIIRAGEEI